MARPQLKSAQKPVPRTYSKIDSDGVRAALNRLGDILDKLGFNVPQRIMSGNTPVGLAIRQLSDVDDLEIINNFIMKLKGDLVHEATSGDPNASKALTYLASAVEDIKDCLS